MKLKILFLFSLLLLTVSSLSARKSKVDEVSALKSATVSYQVINLKTNEIVAEYNPFQCATPASITKTITTATALELLGGDFRFSTYIETNGTIKDGVLNGDLILRGGADPTLGSIYLGDRAFLDFFLKVISSKGIRKINGNIIVDPTCLDRCPASLKWNWEDMGFHYGAACFGLSAYDNTSIITLTSHDFGTKPELTSVWPVTPNLAIINEVKTLEIPNDSVWSFVAPYDLTLHLQGGMPANRNNYVVRTSIPNPPLLIAGKLHDMLNSYGIPVAGGYEVQTEFIPENRTLIYEYQSRPLREIIRLTNFKSNNLYAEHIFRRLGNLIKPYEASASHSIQVVKDFWSKKGIDVSSLFLYDGCGLAPQDAYSAATLNSILKYMRNSDNWADFYNSLPRAGVEGTVGSFLYRTPLKGHAHIKSGSISNVQCFAGYLMPDNGDEYVFTVMMNNYNCKRSEVKQIIESWLLKAIEK